MSLFINHEISNIPCAKCGDDVVEFSIPNDIWNRVIRPNGHEGANEYLCVNCWFSALRIALGIMTCPECNHPTDEHIHKLVGCTHLEIAANGDGIMCTCMLDQQAAEQKMHPTLGESAASDSESKPAPKRVI